MELLQLRYFKDAAESENFSQTARKNMVPQPSISKTISRLEDELGVNLFDRNGKNISLNANGKFFYKKVSDALSNLDEGITHFKHTPSNISIYMKAGNRFISMLTADFLMSTKNIFVSSVNHITNTSKNSCDFTFMQPLENMDSYDYENLIHEEIILVVSKNSPLSKYDELSIKDLKNQNFVAYYRSIDVRDFTDEYCRVNGSFTPNVVFESADYQSLRYMIAKDKGIALMPETFFVSQPSNEYKLIKLKEKTYRTLVIAWNKDKILTSQQQLFLDFTKNWFEKL